MSYCSIALEKKQLLSTLCDTSLAAVFIIHESCTNMDTAFPFNMIFDNDFSPTVLTLRLNEQNISFIPVCIIYFTSATVSRIKQIFCVHYIFEVRVDCNIGRKVYYSYIYQLQLPFVYDIIVVKVKLVISVWVGNV